MNYDLKLIETFICLAELKSFTKVANRLKIVKSLVSSRITEIEEKSNLQLLLRTTREVNLTSDGEEFLRYCKAIYEQVEDLDNFLNDKRDIKGVLKIALPPYFSRCHIVPHLKEFLALHPLLKLDIKATEDPINIIKEGYDLQIRIQIAEEENLKTEKLMSNKKIICASPKYLKKHGHPKSPQDLLQHNCIIFGENNSWELRCKSTKRVTSLHKLQGNIRCNNGEIIKELVLSGAGITLKSACDIESEIRQKKLIVLLPEFEVMNKTSFYAVYQARRFKSAKVGAFINFFKAKFGG